MCFAASHQPLHLLIFSFPFFDYMISYKYQIDIIRGIGMREQEAWRIDGFIGIGCVALFVLAGFVSLIQAQLLLAVFCFALAAFLATGITIVQPNQASFFCFSVMGICFRNIMIAELFFERGTT